MQDSISYTISFLIFLYSFVSKVDLYVILKDWSFNEKYILKITLCIFYLKYRSTHILQICCIIFRTVITA